MRNQPIKEYRPNLAMTFKPLLPFKKSLTTLVILIFKLSCVHQGLQHGQRKTHETENDNEPEFPGLIESRSNRLKTLFDMSQEMNFTFKANLCQGSINFTSYVYSVYNLGFLVISSPYYTYHSGRGIAAEHFKRTELLPEIAQAMKTHLEVTRNKIESEKNRFLQEKVLNAQDSCRESIGKIAMRAYILGLTDAFIGMMNLNDLEKCIDGFMSVQRVVLNEAEQILRKKLKKQGPVLKIEDESIAKTLCKKENSKEKKKTEEAMREAAKEM